LSFLPMLYVAWADEVLSPKEIELINEKIKKQKWLLESEKEQLCQWTDPHNPPSAKELKNWLKLIREVAINFPPNSKNTLVDLGVQVAALGYGGKEKDTLPADALAALQEIEEALDVHDPGILEEMRMQLNRPDGDRKETSSILDVKGIQQVLDRDAPEIKRKMRLLFSEPSFEVVHIRDKDTHRDKVFNWTQIMADKGYGAWAFPSEYGGKADMGGYIAIFEMLGYHDVSLAIKYGVQFGLWGGSVYNLGTKKHHDKYLKDIGTLALPGCFAMTESGHGSNVRDIETTATYDASTQEFVVYTPNEQAFKEYIGNAAVHGQMATVFAQLYTEGECYGVHAFVVRIRDEQGNPMPGVRIGDSGDKLGLNGVDNGRLWFDQVRIPRENLLDRFASVSPAGSYSSPIASEGRRFFTMLSTLVGGRVSVPAAGLSSAKTGLTIAIAYANRRRQFGPEGKAEIPIMEYPTHQRRLLPLLAKSYALDFALKYIKDKYLENSEEDIREVEALAAGIKAVATWHTTKTLQECREACGGNGYLAVNRFADLKADTDIFTTFEGDNTVLMQLVAKGRLSEFKQRFSYMNLMGFVRYFGEKAATVIAEKNPISIRRTDPDHLRSREFLLSAFQYREESLVESAARRIKHRLDEGTDSFQAFLETQNHLVTMAHAYIDRIILEQFMAGIDQVSHAGNKEVLENLMALYALSELEVNSGWYLEQGYIEGSKSKAIRAQVEALCKEVRPFSMELIEAFDIPAQCIAAPIALTYGV
ncbi:MAG: acyl-CoA dehydrogenase, partial [Bacteroidota bacterium]